MILKKANHLARFDDWDQQNRNFMVSKTVVSMSTNASLTWVVFIEAMDFHKMRTSFLASADYRVKTVLSE